MSEHYDFHYQPTGSGAISGQQVLQQTEDAINELGDYVNDNVGGAMDVAQQALETAQNAEQDAQTALDTANSFSSAIQSAQQDASTALSTAQTAQTTASNANNTAIQAQQDASSAVTTANNASGQVNTLSGTVTALGQRVTTAEGNIGQNTSDITALTTRVGTAEGNITTLQNDVTIAQGNASSAMATAGQVKQQAYVFRYSSTALVASSTNSNTLLDNTDNLKVGDKVIDSNGVLFSITAIDTQNSTFTIGTALVDLAQDSDVVHKSGNETVAGVKTFSDNPVIGSNNANITVSNRQVTANSSYSAPTGSSYSFMQLKAIVNYADSSPSIDATVGLSIQENAYSDGKRAGFNPNSNNTINLGLSGKRWANVYATNYYYGGSEIEFSTKFVTTDTDQTISGSKTFNGNTYIYNSDTNATTPALILKNSKTSKGSTSEIGGQLFRFFDKNNNLLSEIESTVTSNGASELRLSSNTLDSNNQNVKTGLTLISNKNGLKRFCPTDDGNVSCGYSTLKWSGVYATNYYYGSNNVEFSTKFVTTDTAQTISGVKTFSDNLTIYNSDDTQTPKGLAIRNAQWGMGESGGVTVSSINFLDKNSAIPVSIMASKGLYGQSFLRFSVRTKDSQNNSYTEEIYYNVDTSGNVSFRPWHDNIISLGTSVYKWKDVQTNLINGLTPSSLSLPSNMGYVDISSYFTNTGDGQTNSYTASANGWIYLNVVATKLIMQIRDSNNNVVYADMCNRSSDGTIYMTIPIGSGNKLLTQWFTSSSVTITTARFIPCQGNV